MGAEASRPRHVEHHFGRHSWRGASSPATTTRAALRRRPSCACRDGAPELASSTERLSLPTADAPARRRGSGLEAATCLVQPFERRWSSGWVGRSCRGGTESRPDSSSSRRCGRRAAGMRGGRRGSHAPAGQRPALLPSAVRGQESVEQSSAACGVLTELACPVVDVRSGGDDDDRATPRRGGSAPRGGRLGQTASGYRDRALHGQ